MYIIVGLTINNPYSQGFNNQTTSVEQIWQKANDRKIKAIIYNN